jgi:hypothetical protein
MQAHGFERAVAGVLRRLEQPWDEHDLEVAVDFTCAEFSSGQVGFGAVTFSGGEVDFGNASFFGSTVDFGRAEFCGSAVDFRARFSSGMVDFSIPSDWSFPPAFPWTDTPPPGVRLPQKEDQSQA